MTKAWVAIDGGQSSTRARASWTDHEPQITGFTHTLDNAHLVAEQIRLLISMLPPAPGPIERVVLGHTGLPVDDDGRAELVSKLIEGRLAQEFVLASDEVIAHAGAFEGRPGIVAAIGTGSVVLGIDAGHRSHRADGWGYLFGDGGSAFAIGRAALEAGLRSEDGRGPATVLARLAAEEFGGSLRDITWRLYADPHRVDRIARFAPSVIAHADEDAAACAIVATAATEIARSLRAASLALHSVGEVSIVGRVVAPGSALVTELQAALSAVVPHARLVEPSGQPLDGASLIAQIDPPLYRHLVYRGESLR